MLAIFRNKIIATLVLVLFLLSLHAQVNDPTAFYKGSYDKAYITKHRIRQIAIESFLEGTKLGRSLFYFDKRGNLVKCSYFDSSGKIENEYIFTNNKYGDKIRSKNIHYGVNRIDIITFERIYQGTKLIKEKSSDLPFVTEHTYSSGGQKIRSVVSPGPDSAGMPTHIFMYEYNEKGRLKCIIETLINKGFEPFTHDRTEFFYDSLGFVIEIVRDMGTIYKLEYNKDGLLKRTKTKMPEDLDGIELFDEYFYVFWK